MKFKLKILLWWAGAATLLVAVCVGFYHWRLADNAGEALRLGQFERAMDLLEESAVTGSVPAQLTLANLHYLGMGGRRDLAAAHRWYESAAMHGNSSAQYNLGLLYHNGYGTAADNVQAAAWFLLADDGGSARAETYLRGLSGMMNPNSIQSAEELKRQLRRKIEQTASD